MSDQPPTLYISAEAVGSTQSVGQDVDQGKARIFPCDGCGADLEFHIGSQQLKCPYCGHEKSIEFGEDEQIAEQDFHAMLARVRDFREEHQETITGVKEVRCDPCGGTVVFTGALTSSECPYCGSPIQLNKVHDAERRVPVDGVLPFLIERQRARDNLKRWVKSRWFAPNEFKRRGAGGKFNGVYLPFWTYDTHTANSYIGERGEHYYVTESYTDSEGKRKTRQVRKTRWWPASGRFQKFFDDVLVPGATGMRQDMLLKLEPWPLGKCVPFTQKYLAGYLARTYELELDAGFEQARIRIDAAIRAETCRQIGGDEQRVHSIKTHYGALKYKLLLLPLWLLAYRYNDKTYQVFVNAATGEVQGERPYSWMKILFTVVGVLVAIAMIVALIVYFNNR